MTDRQDLSLEPGVDPQGDEHLLSRFSGRVDDQVGHFVGRLRWVWNQRLFAILRYPNPVESATLRTLSQHVIADERELTSVLHVGCC